MALTTHPLPFGLRNLVLYPLDAAGNRGTGVPLPVTRTLTFKETEAFEELRGNDRLVASHGNGPIVEWELEGGGISSECWAILSGSTTSTTGTTPNQIKQTEKLVTTARPYFEVMGQSISDSGGAVRCEVYRCKADGDLEASFEQGSFTLTKASGKGYGRLDNDRLYRFYQDETAVALVTTDVPVLESISPATGAAAGGTLVTLVGTRFTAATDVKFASTSASSFLVIDDQHISAIAPAHAAGTVAVTVVNGAGTSGSVNYVYT